MPHKINCELTDEQLGLLCEVLSVKQHELYLRTLDSKSIMLNYQEEMNPRGSKILIAAAVNENREFDICTSLIAAIESSL